MLFGEISRDFGQDIPKVTEKFEDKKNVRVQFSDPILSDGSIVQAQIYTCSFVLLGEIFVEILTVTATAFRNFEELMVIQSSLSR